MEILDKTVWGTCATLYQMHDLQREFDKFLKPHYITLEKNGKSIAVCLINEKKIIFQGKEYPAYYLSVLSVVPEECSKGHASLLVSEATAHFTRLFPDKGIVYAYVEKENERSHRTFKKRGFINIGDFTVPIYSCFTPRKNSSVEKVKPGDVPVIISLLQKMYASHAFLDLGSSFNADDYFVEKENNVIVAGVQVKRFKWSFLDLPGLDGKIILRLFPHLPIIRTIFNPSNYEFLKIGNIYFAEGFENRIPGMVEALLLKESLKVCMAYANTRSPEHTTIARKVKHGILSSVESIGNVYSYFKGFSEEETESFKKVPLHISMSDSI